MKNIKTCIKERKQEICGVAVFILMIFAAGLIETNFVGSMFCVAGIAAAKKIGGLEDVS
ncbi:MAG: hypothetical protein ILA17_06045 [Ruminococcus sp.]|nr:hypothetical protein [Ruminiclostridium sp.]MBP1537410.1 hypothetical protein [Ruminococcus sp.]